MLKKHTFLNIMFGFILWQFQAQEIPPIQVYTPQMYDAENQNWAITQSESSNYIYVANNIGLLEYNGANWQLYPTPNETIMRSVASMGNRVYTGFYMGFGYWERNEFGSLQYTSLNDTLDSKMLDDEQIWKIIPQNEWIVFQSLNRIYLYNIEKQFFKIIESENTITKMFLVDDTIMFQKLNEGIFKIENGSAKLLTNQDLVKTNIVVNIFPYKGNYLVQTNNKGFYLLGDQQLRKWDVTANNLLSKVSVYNSIQLKNKSFLIGTISNGMIHLTKDGDLNYTINQINGLSNNTVLSLFEDLDKNLWLGLDNGINMVDITSPLKLFSDQDGSLGTVYTSAIFEGGLYLGTNQGLFYKKLDTKDDFKFIEGTNGQVWNLIVHDGLLFCGHNLGTFNIKGNRAKPLVNIQGTWDIKPIGNSNNLLLQGNYDGLYVLEKLNGNWQLKHKIKGFNNSSRFFEIGPDNNVFVSHEYKGVFNVKVNNNFSEAIEVSKIPNLNKGLHSSLVKYNNDYLYAYKDGVFKLNKQTNQFVRDSILSSTFSTEDFVTARLIVDDESNRLWTFSDKYLSYISPGKLSATPEINRLSIPSALRKGNTGFENIIRVNDHTYLLGTSNGYLLIDSNLMQSKEHDISINSVTNYGLEIQNPIKVALRNQENIEFDNQDNNIEFSYSVPEFKKYEVTQYQYSFIINRPWYLSKTMNVIYVLLFLGLIILTNYLYKLYYRKQRRALVEKAERDLELKELENEQKLMRFRNEALSKDIDSKNRELAISTMSLIKKNEFLNSIKQELNEDQNNPKMKSVINIIDKNLNNTDDWKFFQEAFNNADKDFLKKIKKIHSSLTPNDLRLCAYLRLNLSSKEIAPLLNISHRSVEVKRYRLRKKMNLPHETSLTSYILEI